MSYSFHAHFVSLCCVTVDWTNLMNFHLISLTSRSRVPVSNWLSDWHAPLSQTKWSHSHSTWGVTRNKHVIGQWVFFIDLQWNRMLAIAKIYDRMVTNRPCFVSLPQLAQFFCAQLHICRWRTVFVWDRYEPWPKLCYYGPIKHHEKNHGHKHININLSTSSTRGGVPR